MTLLTPNNPQKRSISMFWTPVRLLLASSGLKNTLNLENGPKNATLADLGPFEEKCRFYPKIANILTGTPMFDPK